MRLWPTVFVGHRRIVRAEISRGVRFWGFWAQGSRGGCRYFDCSESGPAGRRGLGDQPRRHVWLASPEIGGSGRGCGRVVAPGLPERSRNVASQPAPKRPHCGRTPNSRSPPGAAAALHAQRELHDRREQDQREQHHQDQARAAPHARASCEELGRRGSRPSLAARTPSSAAADRRSSAIAHMPYESTSTTSSDGLASANAVTQRARRVSRTPAASDTVISSASPRCRAGGLELLGRDVQLAVAVVVDPQALAHDPARLLVVRQRHERRGQQRRVDLGAERGERGAAGEERGRGRHHVPPGEGRTRARAGGTPRP